MSFTIKEVQMNILDRKLFKEQVRKELLEELGKHRMGHAWKGEIFVNKPIVWNGIIFVVPEDKWKEWME